eukprot:COSAG04_NODE_11705_length_693_cov_1.031987_1_plen_168_part_00
MQGCIARDEGSEHYRAVSEALFWLSLSLLLAPILPIAGLCCVCRIMGPQCSSGCPCRWEFFSCVLCDMTLRWPCWANDKLVDTHVETACGMTAPTQLYPLRGLLNRDRGLCRSKMPKVLPEPLLRMRHLPPNLCAPFGPFAWLRGFEAKLRRAQADAVTFLRRVGGA